MEVLYFLIPISLVFVALGIGVFFWAVKSGQYDDLEGPAHRILFDDDQTVGRPSESAESRLPNKKQSPEDGSGEV